MNFEVPTLARDEVHVWHLDLTCTLEQATSLESVLCEDERLTAAYFREERFRLRFVTGRALLRGLLAAYLQIDAGEVRFRLGKNGKPELPSSQLSAPLYFNFSHTDDRAVCALTRVGPVGIDLERVRCWEDLPELEKLVFTEHERARLEALDPAQRTRDFFRLWTHKEAFLKATGEGLSLPPESFSVDLATGQLEDAHLASKAWHLVDVTRDRAWPSALAIECKEVRVLQCS